MSRFAARTVSRLVSAASSRPLALHLFHSALLAACSATTLAAQTVNPDTKMETCEQPFGTLAVAEPKADHMRALSTYRLGSPASLLRSIVQKSGCFVIVDRGTGLEMRRAERDLADNGELQEGSNMGKGQIKVADYILHPTVQFSEGNAGGVGGAVGGFMGGRFPRIAGIAGGLKFKEAETNIEITDARTLVQVTATQGKARKTSFSIGALGVLGLGGAVGGYSNTNEGKVVAASFLNNFNNVVRELRGNPALLTAAPVTGMRGQDVKAGLAFASGDVISPKIQGVRVLAEPKDGSRVLVTLASADNVVFLGEANEEYLMVMAPAGKGWVLRVLVEKRR
jgi:curli biogenesis system outer membrane secretion channel CsgG